MTDKVLVVTPPDDVLIDGFRLLLVDLDADLAIEAAAVGHEEKLAFADSIIYTICEKFNATLWTQDEHFSRMPRVQYTGKKKSGH